MATPREGAPPPAIRRAAKRIGLETAERVVGRARARGIGRGNRPLVPRLWQHQTAPPRHRAPGGRRKPKRPRPKWPRAFCFHGARDQIRTGDPHVGNVMLYQLSYSCLNLRGSKPIPAEIFRWRNEELAISRGGFKPPLLTFGSTPLGVPGLLENLSSSRCAADRSSHR